MALTGANSMLNFNNGRLVANVSGNLVTGSGLIRLNGATFISSATGFTSNITSTIVGSGSLTKEDAGTLVLNAINDYTGSTVVNGGVLVADATNFSTGARAPLNAATSLTLSNGTFRFTGTQGLSRTQVVNGLTLNPGSNVVDANHVNTFTGFASPPTTTIDLSGTTGLLGITRNAGATVDFRATTGTFATTAIVRSAQANNATGILGAWATVNNGANLAANNGSNVIVAYAGYGSLDAQAGGANGTVLDNTNANLRIDAAGTSGSVPIAGAVTNINTLLQNFGTASIIDTTPGVLRVGIDGGILISSSGQSLTIGTAANVGTLTAGGNADDVAGDLVLANFSGNTLTVNSIIANNGTGVVTVSKTGGGNVVLNGTSNSYTGTTFVNAGTLTLGASDVIGTGGVTINGGTLAMGTNSDSVGAVALTAGSITGFGGATLTSTSGFTFTNPGAVTISAALAGSVGITKSARGIVTLSGASTFNGATAVNEGVLKAGVVSVANTSGAFGNNSAITMGTALSAGLDITGFNTQIGSLTGGGYGAGGVILGAATLSVGGDGTSPAAYLGPISGTGGVTKIGGGTWTVSGNSSYTGITKIDSGVLDLGFRIANGGIASSMGQSTNAAANLVIGGGTLRYSGTEATRTDRLFTIGSAAGDTAVIDASGTGALAFTNSGPIAFGNTNPHTLTLTGSNVGANSLAPVISDNTGQTSVVKDGVGSWTLASANTHSGTTLVNAGTLALGNVNALQNSTLDTGAAGAQTVTFAVTGTNTYNLGGLQGADAINAGANSLSVGANNTNATFTGDGIGAAFTKVGTAVQDLNGTSQNYGTLAVNDGTLNVNGTLGTGSSVVTVTDTIGLPATKLRFGTVSQTLSSLTIGAGATVVFTSGTASGAFSGGDGGGKAPSFGGGAVVPEPGTIGLLLVGALGMMGRRRRQ
jgi:autotransporter-associated beta strand protein